MTEYPEKPDHISQKDWDSVDVPELTDEEMARAVPFQQAFPDLAKSLKRQGGRPKVEHPKVKVAWRLSSDVVDHVRGIGKGYSARVEAVLKDAISRGVL
jgi:uncharacterized protein (DUF4415 family)